MSNFKATEVVALHMYPHGVGSFAHFDVVAVTSNGKEIFQGYAVSYDVVKARQKQAFPYASVEIIEPAL